MEKKTYTTHERTVEQLKAMDYKRRGYNVTKIVEEDEYEEHKVVAFGYSLKPSFKEIFINDAEEQDFDFIYWN